MSQPPYGPPGPPPPYGYAMPGFAPAPPPPQPPSKRKLLPWLLVGCALLLSGFGVLLVVLLRGHDATRPQAAPHSTAGASSPSSPTASAATHGGLPAGGQIADQNGGGQAHFATSDRVALTWVQAMADGEFQTAYDLSCADVRRSAIAADDGSGPARALGTYFFQRTLSGRGFREGTFDSIIYNQDAASDIASFTLQMDDGQEFLLLVYVQGDGTVCDFI